MTSYRVDPHRRRRDRADWGFTASARSDFSGRRSAGLYPLALVTGESGAAPLPARCCCSTGAG
ncbi:MAG: hypothetical protein ACRDRB_25735, partial [Pseudonocardiaceae bacterium]